MRRQGAERAKVMVRRESPRESVTAWEGGSGSSTGGRNDDAKGGGGGSAGSGRVREGRAARVRRELAGQTGGAQTASGRCADSAESAQTTGKSMGRWRRKSRGRSTGERSDGTGKGGVGEGRRGEGSEKGQRRRTHASAPASGSSS